MKHRNCLALQGHSDKQGIGSTFFGLGATCLQGTFTSSKRCNNKSKHWEIFGVYGFDLKRFGELTWANGASDGASMSRAAPFSWFLAVPNQNG